MEIKLALINGPHQRTESLVPISIPRKALGREFTQVRGGSLKLGRDRLPVQVRDRGRDSLELLARVPEMQRTAEAEAVLTLDRKAPARGGVRLTLRKEAVDIRVRGSLFTRYNFSAKRSKTFLHPLIGPYGDDMVRTLKGGHDHPHQRGIFGAHGDVNGIDAWNEPPVHGRVRHRKLILAEQGPVFARIKVLNWWLGPDDKSKLLQEIRTMTFYDLPTEFRTLDHDMELIAAFGPVTLGTTKEAGVMGVRMHDELRGQATGMIENSYGAAAEAECWGRKAHWVDYWGKLNNKTVGLAVFDDPSNPFYPTTWHVRDYGLFAPNPWFWLDAPVVLNEQERLRFNYRVLVHPGNTRGGKVAERFIDFAAPIRCKIIEA